MKRKRNPYVEVQKWLSRIGYALLVIVALGLLAAVLVVLPVAFMLDGMPWWRAFMPLFILVGVVALSLLAAVIALEIERRWKRASRNWERRNR